MHKHAKISKKMQNEQKNVQTFAKMLKNTTKFYKSAQNFAKKCAKIQKISTAGKN